MSVLAFDLGAGSGRALLGRLKEGKLTVEEIHRFPNDPVQVGNRLHWDILRLYHEIKAGMRKAAQAQPGGVRSMGIDSWAVDFGLIGRNGELLGNPYHYRDHHSDGVMEDVAAQLGQSYIFGRTGIQFLPFNTIYQLHALKTAGSPLLEQADTLLMIPDLLRYFLTGEKRGEFTNATTTQLYNPLLQSWDDELLSRLGLARSLFPNVLQPGQTAGFLTAGAAEETGLPVGLPVTAVAEHDTGSAVVAVPSLERDFAYLSCGTWSLMGTEVDRPVLGEEALRLDFTNEGGYGGTYRLLKNIMGLWLLQECKRMWEQEGKFFSYGELIQMAEQANPFAVLIDPDHPDFLNPVHMPRAIDGYCRATGQTAPADPGAYVRCILESLALKYRYVLERTEQLSGKHFSGLHMVGGGIQNEMLCRFTANAIRRPVWAGPAEGSAIGNIAVQFMALGELADLQEARSVIRSSFGVRTYEPSEEQAWTEAYGRFTSLFG